jgi:hypothetical protein
MPNSAIPSRVRRRGSYMVRLIVQVYLSNDVRVVKSLSGARNDSVTSLWFEGNRHDETPLLPRFRAPLVKRGDGGLIEGGVAS